MILIDREDVIQCGLADHTAFQVHWNLNDPVQFAEGAKVDWIDILADGPFLLVANDEYAWAGQGDRLYMVAGKRYDPINRQRWGYLADLYAEEMGISRQSLVKRFTAMRKLVSHRRGDWLPWGGVYHWPEGRDLAWSALLDEKRDQFEKREYNGQRQVRYAR